ncbi:MAG: O-antigen ligase family protein [Deltaproteobacteria bacterium]|nr:O-antigen ligase family protein [Deltaproteobacteria bacterium]
MSLPFLIFTCWVTLTTFFAIDKQNSIHDLYSHLIKYIIFFYVMVNFFASKRRLDTVSWTIIISTSVFSLGSLIYEYAVLGNSINLRFGLSLVQTPTNLIGVVTLFGIILCLHGLLTKTGFTNKVVLALCLVPLSAVTMLTRTRSNIIALGATLILIFPFNKKAAFAVVGCTLLLTSISHAPSRWQLNHLLNNERLGMCRIAYQVIKDYPVTGIGFGMHTYGNKLDLADYKARVSNWQKSLYIMKYPHNMFVSVAVRTGIPGFLLFLAIIGVSVKMCFEVIGKAQVHAVRGWGYCSLSLLVMFLTKGLFEPVLTHLTEVVFFTILSMIAVLWRIHKKHNAGFVLATSMKGGDLSPSH